MNKAKLVEMKEDRLANTAIVAFLGSLLMGQAWGMWEGSGRATNLFMLTVPDYSGLVIFTFMVGLFGLSLFLGTASIVTPFQRWGLVATDWVKPIMVPILLTSFVLSWSSSTLELPHDQWRSPFLLIGGFAMFIFIGFKSMVTTLRRFVLPIVGRNAESKKTHHAELDGSNHSETSRTTGEMPFLNGRIASADTSGSRNPASSGSLCQWLSWLWKSSSWSYYGTG